MVETWVKSMIVKSMMVKSMMVKSMIVKSMMDFILQNIEIIIFTENNLITIY